ncbi:hypothetical protein HXX76_010182 [Chlamydomonas incerta]|uniref:Uncharacterized protein n=1 Tax=Chlamydomonas incerta TaxID=51695 RepID=A0A835SUL9_CHLIN|nr:hypothetical protein HXX76_010182 [Chlamydomonas incerta]|eukprot:KAG2430083.1 hypothetical protein HXX76_010182 [Chlamydomonas incerta]
MGRGLNWGVFNAWWREHLAKHGERPKAEDLKRWYNEESRRAFPHDPPTYTMIRNHAKGLRDIAAVKHYFRDYRARKRRAFADLEGQPTSKQLPGDEAAATGGDGGSGSGDDAAGGAGDAAPGTRSGQPATAQRPQRRRAGGGAGGRGGMGRGRGSSCSGSTTEVETEGEDDEHTMSCSSDEDWSSEGGPKRRRQQRRAQRQAAAVPQPGRVPAEQAGPPSSADLAGAGAGPQGPWGPALGLKLDVAGDMARDPAAGRSRQPHSHQCPDDCGDAGLEDLPTVLVRVTGGSGGAVGALPQPGKLACAEDAAVCCKREPDASGEEAGTPTKRLAAGRGTPRSSFAPFLARIHGLPPASAPPPATAAAAAAAAAAPPAVAQSSVARGGPFAAAAAAALAGAATKGTAPSAGTAAAGPDEGLFMGLHGVGGTLAGGAGSLGLREFTGSVSIGGNGGGGGGGGGGSGCFTSGSLGLNLAAAAGRVQGDGAGSGGGAGAGSPSAGGGSRGCGGGSGGGGGGSFTSQHQGWTPFAITVPGAASVTAPMGACYGGVTEARQSTNTGAMDSEPAAAAAAGGTSAAARAVDAAAAAPASTTEAAVAPAAGPPAAKAAAMRCLGGDAEAAPAVNAAGAPSNASDATLLELVPGGSDDATATAAGAATANSQPGADAAGRAPAVAALRGLHQLDNGSGSGTPRATSGTFATLATLPPSPALHHPPPPAQAAVPPAGYPRADSPAGGAARRGVPWLHHPAHHAHLLSLAAAGRAGSSPLSHAPPGAQLPQHGGGAGGGGGGGGATAAAAGSGPGSPAAWSPGLLAASGRQMSLPNLPHLGEGAVSGSPHAGAAAPQAPLPRLTPAPQAALAPAGPPPVTTGFAPSKGIRNASASAGAAGVAGSAAAGGGSPSSPSGGASPAVLRPPPVTSLPHTVAATPSPGGSGSASGCLPDAADAAAAGAGPTQLQEEHSPSPRAGAHPAWATAGAGAAAAQVLSSSNTSAGGDAAAAVPPQPTGWGPRPGPPFGRARWYPHGHPHHAAGWYPYPYPYPPHPHHHYPGAAGAPPGAPPGTRPGMPPYPYLGPYGSVRRRYVSAPSQPYPHPHNPQQHFYAAPPSGAALGAGGAPAAGPPGLSRLAGGARGPAGSRAAALELLAADPWMTQGYEDLRPAGMASAGADATGGGRASASASSADAGTGGGCGAAGQLSALPPPGPDQATSPHPAGPYGAHAPAWPPPSGPAAAHGFYHPYARQSTDTYGFGNEFAGAAGGPGGAPRTSNGAGSGSGQGNGGGLDELWGMCDDAMMSHVLDMFENNDLATNANHAMVHTMQHTNHGGSGTVGGAPGQAQPFHMPQQSSHPGVGYGAAPGAAAAWHAAGPAGMWPLVPPGGGPPYCRTPADAHSSGGAPPQQGPPQ